MTTKPEIVSPLQGPILIEALSHPGQAIYSQPLGVLAYGGDVVLSVDVGGPGWFSVEGSFDVAQTWTHRFLEPTRLAPKGGPQQVKFSTATPHDRYSGCTHLRCRWEPDPLDFSVRVEHLSGSGQFYRDHPHLVPDGQNGPARRLARWLRSKASA